MSMPPLDRETGDLPDQRHHRGAHPIGRQQCGGGVQQSGARYDGEGLRPARDERRAERHVGRGLLMARVNHAEPIARPVRGIEQMIVVDAGHGVEGVDPVADQTLDRCLSRGHTLHAGPSTSLHVF